MRGNRKFTVLLSLEELAQQPIKCALIRQLLFIIRMLRPLTRLGKLKELKNLSQRSPTGLLLLT
jgi:hypothetical protein